MATTTCRNNYFASLPKNWKPQTVVFRQLRDLMVNILRKKHAIVNRATTLETTKGPI